MPEQRPFTDARVRRYPWRVFFFLLLGSLLGMLAVLPYLKDTLGPTLTAHPLPLPLPILALLQLLQGLVTFTVAIGLGLLAARQLGLGAPILERWLYHDRSIPVRPIFFVASVTGLILGVITLVAIMSPLGETLRHLTPVPESRVPLWKRLLACLYGGLDEEVLMRLFLLSVVLWLLMKLFRATPRNVVLFWSTNVLVAIAFGAGHLPFAATLGVLTPSLVTVIICVNGFVALAFGYLYWTRGLEAAMLAHFSADFVLHVFGPLFIRN